jgi:hypothetical protein
MARKVARMINIPSEKVDVFSAKKLHFTPCFAIFFSAENITAENVSLYGVFRSIFQR